MSATATTATMDPVDILILGAGWTSTFLLPLLASHEITFAATTTTGRAIDISFGNPPRQQTITTIPFSFDPTSSIEAPYNLLPPAKTILITFPLTGAGPSKLLTSLYATSHPSTPPPQWIQLGSTRIFKTEGWNTSSGPYDTANPRAIAEDELMSCANGAVLNLAGLWGGERFPPNWITRVAKSKEDLRAKGAVHLVHGRDVARAVLAVHERFTKGKRWIVTDLRVWDWWQVAWDWGSMVREKMREKEGEEADKLEYEKWVVELMSEEGVRALSRPVEMLGRVLDGRDFWEEMRIWPEVTKIERENCS